MIRPEDTRAARERTAGDRTRWTRQIVIAAALALLAAAVVLTGLPPLAAIPRAGASTVTLLAQDFEAEAPGGLPIGWTAAAGTWAVAQDTSQVLQRTDTSTSLKGIVATGAASWADYTVRVDARPGANNPSGMLEIMARYADANNHYGLLMQQGSQWYLGKKVAGVWIDLASGTFAYNTGWHTLSLTAQGTTLSATVDGASLATVTDTTFATGAIALSAKATAAFDTVSVTTSGVAGTPTPIPSPSPTSMPSPSPTPAPTSTPSPPSTGSNDARLSVSTSASGVTVRSLDTAQNGWQAFFNANAGGAITSLQEVNTGAGVELMDQVVLHGLVQSYLQIGGGWYANQLQPGQVTILRETPELVNIRTVTTNPTYMVTWMIDYAIWSDGTIAVALRIQNASGKAIKLSTPDSIEVNMDGLLVTKYPDRAPTAWYGKDGAIKSPVPTKVNAIEADFFGLTPAVTAPPSLSVFVDKLTPWSAAGVTSYGIASIFNERRVKMQWMGTLPTFAAGQEVPVSLLLELRRGLTQSQSVGLDADYRNPAVSVNAGAVVATDDEPVTATLRNAFNPGLGAYVIDGAGHHVSAAFDLSNGVTTRFAPRIKITNWTAGSPVLMWDGIPLAVNTDYRYTRDPGSGALYIQLAFDVVAANPGPGQRMNAPLDVS